MPPPVRDKWLQELFTKIEPMPDECYGIPEHAIEMSKAISLKRIADALEAIVKDAPP